MKQRPTFKTIFEIILIYRLFLLDRKSASLTAVIYLLKEMVLFSMILWESLIFSEKRVQYI